MKNNKTIVIDWLQISLGGGIRWEGTEATYTINSQIILEDLKHGSKHFRRMATVVFNGENIGSIQFEPRNPEIVKSDTVIFKAENRILYGKGYITKIMDFIELSNLNYKHITLIDIALDSEQVGKGVFDFVRQLQQGKIRYVGRAEYTVKSDSNNNLKYFRMGERVSDKLVRCYYKKSEILQSQKTYITEFWKHNKIDTTKEIERVEISMKKKELYKYHKFKKLDDLLYLENPEFLASLFMSGCKGYFEFVSVQEYFKKKKQANRCQKKSFFNLNDLGGSLLLKMKTKISTEIFRLKQLAKTCYIIAKNTGCEIYAAASWEVAHNIQHEDWYENSKKRWDNEYKLYKKSGRYKFLTKFNIQFTDRERFHAVIKNAYV